jgi:hypothetical protein
METSWFDGGTVWQTDIISAIVECRKKTSDENIFVDVIYTTDKHLKQVDASEYSAISMAIRYLQISHYYKNADDLLRARYAYP